MSYAWRLVVLAGLLMSACTQFSADTLRLVDPKLTFGEIKRYPEKYTGSYLLLAGQIVTITNRKEGGEIEIVQVNTDGSGRPLADLRSSQGRFLALTDSIIDPAVYKGGMFVSLVGEIKGERVQPLDGVPYGYPLLAVRELHLWQPYDIDRYDASYPPYSRYSSPYDYPYGYGFCDFGFGPSPYNDLWGQNYCYPYYRQPFIRPRFPRFYRPRYR